MSGISIPFIEGSVAEYTCGLDRLEQTARPRGRSAAAEWARTLATCGALFALLWQALPWLPATLHGQAEASASPPPSGTPTAIPAAARAPAAVRLDGGIQPAMMPTEHQITANAALDKLTEAMMASPAARMLKF